MSDNLSEDNAATEKTKESAVARTSPLQQNRFAAWLSRQSLPRLIGVFLSNTHDLEIRLSDKDAEIGRLHDELDWWKNQYTALTDSFLLSRGNKPTVVTTVKPTETTTVFPATKQLEFEIEADRLAELMIFDPPQARERVEDMIHSGRPRDKEILRRFNDKLAAMPLNDLPTDGVVIG